MQKPRDLISLLNASPADAPAIGAPGRVDLTFGELCDMATDIAAGFNAVGIGSNDRVAIVLPNGPEMASAFITMAASSTTAPLNPSYKADEFEFYLEDLKPKILIIQAGEDSPAIAAAEAKDIQVVTLTPDADGSAGKFTLKGLSGDLGNHKTSGFSKADDVALILHTSGTTSRPKMVPLSQQNLCASAFNVATTLQLSNADRCLNIMPLFHIHGLIAAVSASLCAGAAVSCTPGFNALKVFGWLDDVKPSWYTAVPTMHQAILARAARNANSVENASLRLIRSSSSSLPPQVMAELEATFGAPVIESYGMTEAAHQMASNPLPPAVRKPGSVGIAAGPQVAIMSESNSDILAQGEIGEIVIRGDNVTAGYLENPEANRTAFTEGWFRTGDQGQIDEDGYLSLTGRLKEIINRGGEKISPREVDEILMDHPAVAQAVTFAIPHDKLGEEVAAAVVLREGGQADEAEIRMFAGERLADFKTPRKVLILEEIPKGATGKLQRIGLAEKLGLAG
jgi:acyl-CoA synthetase (AMP-forming)/AMP-acid ligase II